MSEVTQELREEKFETLCVALQDYYKILALDFNDAKTDEDEEFLDSEMKRTETFLIGLSEDKMNELRQWSETEGAVK
jgi:hypothetical protein